jgi:hypothetical protein
MLWYWWISWITMLTAWLVFQRKSSACTPKPTALIISAMTVSSPLCEGLRTWASSLLLTQLGEQLAYRKSSQRLASNLSREISAKSCLSFSGLLIFHLHFAKRTRALLTWAGSWALSLFSLAKHTSMFPCVSL